MILFRMDPVCLGVLLAGADKTNVGLNRVAVCFREFVSHLFSFDLLFWITQIHRFMQSPPRPKASFRSDSDPSKVALLREMKSAVVRQHGPRMLNAFPKRRDQGKAPSGDRGAF